MQIEQLEYIVSVAENKSFSKAAQVLHISQSAISQSIIKLEVELGVQIFERSNTGVNPTEEGTQLIKFASESLEKLRELKNQADYYKNRKQKELKIGLVTGLHLPFLSNIIAKLRKEFPALSISFVEQSSTEIVDAILNKELDVGILAIYEKTLKYQNLLSYKKFHKIKMYVFVNKNSPLASYDSVTPQDLLNQTFVMYNGGFTNWYFEKFTKKFGELEVLFTTKNSETIRETVKNGLAITIETEVESLNNPYVKSGEIIPIRLAENIPDNSYRGLVKLKSKTISIETKTFIEYLENEIQLMFIK